MNGEIRILIESLRRGHYENPDEKIGLLSATLRENKVDLDLLRTLLRTPSVPPSACRH